MDPIWSHTQLSYRTSFGNLYLVVMEIIGYLDICPTDPYKQQTI